MSYSLRVLPSFLFLLLLSFTTQAQRQSLTGMVQDASNKQSLGYVNIGWVDHQLGTVSDEKGAFTLAIPENIKDSTVLRFSMIGYQAKNFFWKDLKNQKKIAVELTSVVTEIEEITIVDCSSATRKQKGNVLKKEPIGWMSFVSKELGTEIATKIRLKKRHKNHIKSMILWVGNHDLDTLFFRLNVYAVEDGRPGENLLTENIFVTITANDENCTIDLEPYRLVYEQDVFVGLEYVRALESAKDDGITFGSNFFGKHSYVRFASQSKWFKTPILNLGFSLEVCEQK